MKRSGIFILLLCSVILAKGQNERKFVRRGNDLFMDAIKDTTKLDTTKFRQAEIAYRQALDKKPDHSQWNFNLADAMYKQMKFEESAEKFGQLSDKFENPEEKARALHNKGNSLLFNQKLEESIEAYKEALRLNPDDIETKYNLAYAQSLKKQQQQQQKQQQKNQDQNQNNDQQNQNQDQNQNKDQQNKDQQQNKQDQDQQQNKQDQDQQKEQQQRNKISKENAEQLLEALQNDERKIQKKVKKAQAAKAKKVTIEKDW